MTTSPPLRLDDLIRIIADAHPEPLDRLTNAVVLAERIGGLADSLIGHFVDRARAAGASWSEIGQSMGVSKQAVQKRFVTRGSTRVSPLDPSQGFSRFSDDARAVVVAAQQHAREAHNATIGVGHLVLALVGDPDSAAGRAIAAQGVSADAVRRIATATLPSASGSVPDMIPFDAHARDALETSFAEAQRLGSENVGGEHLLLALLAVEDGTGVLAGLGVTAASVEASLTASDGESGVTPPG